MATPIKKIMLITGATDGIGKQTALELAQMGHHVIVHGRDPKRIQNTLIELQNKIPAAELDSLCADLGNLNQVRQMAADFKKKYSKLDVLINNAGVYMKTLQKSADGFEMTFAVNHLAHFLLTNLLLDLLKQSAPSRIVTVASRAHRQEEIDFENLNAQKSFDGYGSYALSKLCNIMFTFELARRLSGSFVTANCLHPSVINTKLLRTGFGMGGDSVQNGCRNSIYLATAPELEKVSGKYFTDQKESTSARVSYDPVAQKKLWDISEKFLENNADIRLNSQLRK